ncbi:cysteine and glycine-rich protein 1 [Eurytemora carolleeae]|uniref:cysteine and glycine-rich protein 1 n=1 Tax=Eurytemora carolleeae TaxID=1294199 RepID=UPI000C75D534|nr:cysteine and glycine-rich protein 1 [Eurytemora carolleeae]XP_023345865.1 cysteine and glycine-rich protein 1 [Eurytemora carolleeae]|eukprot:XP_023345864.1 cysteine and glycine-rich protein 1-like [Eurytemora affinis]
MPGVCQRCDKNVYFAEEVKGLGKSWHKLCFTCQACRKMLSSGSISEHDNQVFCNSCYRKNFGPKGYGFGVGSGTLSMDDGKGYQTNPNEIDHKAKAYIAPKKPLVQSNTENTVAPSSAATAATAKFKPKWGGADICPRCEKSVFIAELMRGAGKAWHKSCFTCQLCNKRVDSSMLCEREGEIYCKSCYGRNFGPKGVGFGIGAGTLQTN